MLLNALVKDESILIKSIDDTLYDDKSLTKPTTFYVNKETIKQTNELKLLYPEIRNRIVDFSIFYLNRVSHVKRFDNRLRTMINREIISEIKLESLNDSLKPKYVRFSREALEKRYENKKYFLANKKYDISVSIKLLHEVSLMFESKNLLSRINIY